MLSLPSKQGEKVDLYKPLLSNVEAIGGAQISSQLEPVLKRLQQYRDDLLQLAGFRNDSVALEKLAGESKEYISIWNNISQSFTFGKSKESIDIRFTWYDSHTREKKVTTNSATERLATLYNLAVIYSQIGTNMASLPDDHFKDAANSFLTAAWIFEKIKVESGGLKSPDFGMDLSEQNLHMYSYIMKAQAQHCTHEKVKRSRPDKYDLLAKLAMQASAYYGNAYSYASTPPLCKALDPKKFTAILQFNETSFMAQAYYWDALDKQKKCNDSTEGMGKAVASIQKANQYLEAMKKYEKTLAPAILNPYKELCKQLQDKKALIESQNAKIYHENVPATVTEIDPMPFGQPLSIEADLNKSYDGQEILLRMVPPAVRELEEEYKKEVGITMAQAFDISKKNDTAQGQFLAKHGLPAALHAISGEQSLPEDLWQRIKQCKERGGSNGLMQILNGVATMAENNNTTIQKLFGQLKQEEDEDQGMRARYGTAWSRLPSSAINQTMITQLNYYKQKYDQGRAADQKISEMIQAKKGLLDLLDLDRDALTARIPKSPVSNEQLSPAAAKLTELLKDLENLKKDSDSSTEALIKSFEAESVSSDMTQIYQKIKDKRITFDELKAKYVNISKDLEENGKKRQSLFSQIDGVMVEFNKERSSSSQSSERANYFKSLDDACNAFNECHTNAQQGGHFHTQLGGYIAKNIQAVSDFIMSRTLEKNELIKMIGGQNFTSLGGQNPYGGPRYPGGYPGGPGGPPGGPGAPGASGYGMPQSYSGYQANPYGQPPRPSYPPY